MNLTAICFSLFATLCFSARIFPQILLEGVENVEGIPTQAIFGVPSNQNVAIHLLEYHKDIFAIAVVHDTGERIMPLYVQAHFATTNAHDAEEQIMPLHMQDHHFATCEFAFDLSGLQENDIFTVQVFRQSVAHIINSILSAEDIIAEQTFMINNNN